MLSDTLTVVFFSTLLISFLGLLQLWLWRQDRALAALGIWGAAHLVGAVGLVLLMGRGVLPNRLSIDVANATVVLGYGLVWAGARRFERQPVQVWITLAGAAIWLAACQVPAFYSSLANRTAGGSVLVGIYDLLVMREFLRQRTGGTLPSRRALAVAFCAEAVIQGARAAIALGLGFDRSAFSLPASTAFGVPVMIGTVLAAGMSMLLIAVAKEEAERRSVTALALARDTADRANAAKSQFLTRMSHELRTPLNGILGMAQVLERDPSLQGEQRERVVLLEQAGRHLLAIVNDLLDLVRIEAGKLELSPRPVPVSDLVRGSVNLVAETAAAKGVALTAEIAEDVPAAVLADALRVRQILVNLLGNSIKFTPSGGKVVLSVSRDGADGALALKVTDTGPGVAAEILPHLFQDFVSRPPDASTSEGAGLGLAISASLARAMGGTISHERGPNGVGSVFTAALPLPAADLAEAQAPTQPAAQPLPPGLRVLVVDDVASNRKLADAMLRQAGFSVALADSGAAAVAALAAGAVPDVVLMDLYMPEMDGLTATRRIRTLAGAAGRVPVIALTADVSSDRMKVYQAAGMNGCITKPLDVGDLLATIAQVLPDRAAKLPGGRVGEQLPVG
jgi:signal transduction histidine kinase/CheY-like chemotaxis protein